METPLRSTASSSFWHSTEHRAAPHRFPHDYNRCVLCVESTIHTHAAAHTRSIEHSIQQRRCSRNPSTRGASRPNQHVHCCSRCTPAQRQLIAAYCIDASTHRAPAVPSPNSTAAKRTAQRRAQARRYRRIVHTARRHPGLSHRSRVAPTRAGRRPPPLPQAGAVATRRGTSQTRHRRRWTPPTQRRTRLRLWTRLAINDGKLPPSCQHPPLQTPTGTHPQHRSDRHSHHASAILVRERRCHARARWQAPRRAITGAMSPCACHRTH